MWFSMLHGLAACKGRGRCVAGRLHSKSALFRCRFASAADRTGRLAMLPKAESACFVIADISGYTHFVSGVELDHAQDIIADIMDTLVRALRPPFRLAKFE